MIHATGLVRAEYTRQRPAWGEDFSRNAKLYQQRLTALKEWGASQMSTLPASSRHFVSSHDAFGYLAHDYGLAVHSISGLSTESEPDARRMTELVNLIRREHIRAIFAEESANSRLLQNLARETGVRIGGALYADGLGPADSDAATYGAMYRHNVRTIVESLRSPSDDTSK
ncbi:hypothetical protein AW736_08080 [Termitidicoccus mucosus]|uniref:Uncharacterized protein n=2 Tax=Termitidicoccus mucosus TaxID=1184151 RepID=A0A178IMY2_9BACT|nr:hypothetical protein AW736_08080 [Opitutaceae bacterium TSB47]